MAGIGFELRKLLRRDDLMGILQGYSHSALIATGPWLLTVLTLSGIVLVGQGNLTMAEISEFRLIIIYNFAFSLVMAGPFVMVATRYLADAIYVKKVDEAPSMLMGYLVVLLVLESPIVIPFYFWFAKLSLPLAMLAVVNFYIISTIWLLCAFLSALKDYSAITKAFVFGSLTAIMSAYLLAWTGSIVAMMFGFTVGLAAILFMLMGSILVEYPYPITNPFRNGRYFLKYWELALSGLVYNVAIWIDKWIMWFAPEHEVQRSGLMSYPDYDSAMFLAYLTIVPSIAAFVISLETDFFERYLQFYRVIQNHLPYSQIDRAHREIVRSTLRGARTFIVLQGSICLVTILIAPRLFTALQVNFAQIGIFRIGVLGAFFHILFLSLSIMLSYFDQRMATLRIQLVFLVSNAFFTIVTLRLGFKYYGFGYFLATLTTFAVTFLFSVHFLARLPYQTFIVSNTSVER